MPKVQPTHERLYGPLERGFGKRIEAAAGTLETKATAAETMGVSTDMLAHYVAERSVPNFAAMAALAARVKRSLDWFAFAKGGDYDDSSTRKSFSSADDTVTLSRFDDGPRLPFSRAWLHKMFDRHPDDLAIIDAPGNAMEPIVKRGALLIIDTQDQRLADGELFLFDYGTGNFVVRRSQLEVDGSVVLRADNESYEPKSLLPEEVEAAPTIGRVVWIGSGV